MHDDDLEVDAEVAWFTDSSSSADTDTSTSSDDSTTYTVYTRGNNTQVMVGNVMLSGGIQIGSGSNVVVQSGNSTGTSHVTSRRKRPDYETHHHHAAEPTQITMSVEPLSKPELNMVCREIGKSWRKLGKELGLRSGDLDRVEMDYSIEGAYEMAWQTLQIWRRRNGDGQANKSSLAKALCNIGHRNIAKGMK